MASYGDLQSQIASNLRQSNLGPDIALSINYTIASLKETHTWFNENVAVVQLTAGDPMVPMPSDFQYEMEKNGLVLLYSNLTTPLKKLWPVEYDINNVRGQGRPWAYKCENNQLWVYFYPDINYFLRIFYVKDYPYLVEDSDQNDWTVNAPDLVTSMTMETLYRYNLKDLERADNLATRNTRLMSDIQERTRRRVATGRVITDGVNARQFYTWPLIGQRALL